MPELFNQNFFLGFVNVVKVGSVVVHIPASKNINKFFLDGKSYQGGLINQFVTIESEERAFFGQVTYIGIPEKERNELSAEAMKIKDFHPTMTVEIISTFDYYNVEFNKTISSYPNIGSKVYISSEEVVKRYISEIEINKFELKTTDFAKLLQNTNVGVDFSFQSLFSRHMAIVGTTGSGKSWTTMKLIENVIQENQKMIVIDATGEYRKSFEMYGNNVYSLSLGIDASLPYESLDFDDLIYLVRPSEGIQMPKLRDAISSLKLVRSHNSELVGYINGNNLVKQSKQRQEFQNVFSSATFDEKLGFNIEALAQQVENECIWENAPSAADRFGGRDDRTLGFCIPLISRINNFVNTPYNRVLFAMDSAQTLENIFNVIENFWDNDKNVLHINLSSVPYSQKIREVAVNLLGKSILCKARDENNSTPKIIVVDEAHQFLNKTTNSEFESFRLDAIESIAKEGRKYGVFLVLSTQLPRDIPTKILSQVGTFLVHRLINYSDKEVIASAMPSAGKDIVKFLPELGEGELIISSNNFASPLLLRANRPKYPPKSLTPTFEYKEKRIPAVYTTV